MKVSNSNEGQDHGSQRRFITHWTRSGCAGSDRRSLHDYSISQRGCLLQNGRRAERLRRSTSCTSSCRGAGCCRSSRSPCCVLQDAGSTQRLCYALVVRRRHFEANGRGGLPPAESIAFVLVLRARLILMAVGHFRRLARR